MAFAPLILRGNLEIDGVDVSEQVTEFRFAATRAQIDIPQTFGSRASYGPGSDTYEVTIAYLADTDAEAISQIFWTAIADDTGTVEVAGTFRPGAVSATNPQWVGTALVVGAGVGGEVATVALDSQTFPLLDRPTQVTAP